MSLLQMAQRMINDCPTDSPDFVVLSDLIVLVHLAEALCHVFHALEPDECDGIPNDLRGLVIRLGAALEHGS